MNPALQKLILLSFKSGLRRAFPGVRTVKGAFLILFTVGTLTLMIGPSLFASVMLRGSPGIPEFSGWVEPFLPIMILGLLLLGMFGSAGETMLLMLLQFLILIPTLGFPAAIGGLIFWLSGFSWLAFAVTSWCLLAAELPLLLIVLARFFERFDPSADIPP